MIERFLALVALVAIGTNASGAAQQRAARAISARDFRRLVHLSDPAISPDGKRAVVLVSRPSWNDDTWNAELVLVNLETRARRVLTYDREDLSEPRFSPDGTRLAFIAKDGSGKGAKPQVFVMPLDGGDAVPVTHQREGVEQYAWRPDGKALAFVAEQAPPERKGAARFRDSFVFTTEPIVAREKPQPAHVFVVTLATRKSEQLTFGARSVTTGEAQSTLSWSPGGKTIAFTSAPNDILNDESDSRVAFLNVASKRVRYPTGHESWESDPLIAPDGKRFAYVWSDGDPQVNLVQLYVAPIAGGAGTAASAAVDRPVYGAGWSPDSKMLYFTAPVRSTIALFAVPAGGGAPTRVSLGDLVIASSPNAAIGPAGMLVFVASAARQPAELYERAADGRITKLTDFNASIAALDLASSQRLTYPTSLGTNGDAVLLTPPGFTGSRRYPLVLFIHGGPTSSSTLGFDFWAQVMAAHGWLVLLPNYRGSDDLGLRYQRAVLYDPEEGPGRDVMAALRAVRARGIVDDRRIAVSGWSYGGIMTAWMISKYHIWRAAVSGASVDDWITDYGTADDSRADVDLFHGSPYVAGNAAEWRRASAIVYARDVTTPVLILSDVGDNRDPFATSSMYWRALRDNHKDATLRVWPVAGHFPRDPVRIADVFHYWIGYIAQHFRT
jgi:dipeptidyl aminopeptidase/acylaminoacyl peptidase